MNPALSAVLTKGKLVFHYIKSNYFRVVYATGVHGGVSPKGDIEMAFFNERNPLPDQVAFSVTRTSANAEDLKLGSEIPEEKVVKDGIVREVEVEVVMNRDTARAVYDWLGERIGVQKGEK
jgi:hypothetical protein